MMTTEIPGAGGLWGLYWYARDSIFGPIFFGGIAVYALYLFVKGRASSGGDRLGQIAIFVFLAACIGAIFVYGAPSFFGPDGTLTKTFSGELGKVGN